MKPPDCNHCLRPTQTGRIVRELLEQRRPINLIGKPGQGRGRLLADLMRIDPDAVRWLCVDLKEHRHSFVSMLNILWGQTGLPGRPPRTLGGLVDKLVADDRPICLLLHHFDAILDNPDLDAGFDVKFLNALNALKNRGISLLCVTERTHDRYLMMTRSGERRVSTLTLEPEELAPLSQAEIRSEIGRGLSDLDDKDVDLLADAMVKHPRPLPFLGYVQRRIQDGDAAEQAFSERLGYWQDAFKARDKGVAVADANKLRHRIVCWYRASGLDRIKLPLTGLLKQLLKRWPGGKAKRLSEKGS